LNTGIRLIILGGSAGSLQVILKLFTGMEAYYPIPVVVVLHRSQTADLALEELIGYKTSLRVKELEEKEKPEPGCLYLCPPDYHLLIEEDWSFTLDYSEKVNFCRPSIDVTFQSAADVFGESLVCILLSGANADGAEGLAYVKQKKGITIVQHPDEAEVSYMPEQALLRKKADYVLTTAEIRNFIENLRNQEAG
jgi:two-component system, chemotaxis family, protein-glutamate methylesterase/glutaminase